MDAPDNGFLPQTLSSKSPAELEDMLISAAIDNDVYAIKNIVECTKTNCDKALFYAASQGHTQSVELLLQQANPQANDSEAFRIACQFGMIDVVKLLLPVSNPQANHNHSLRAAASNGHADVVEYILPFTNPKDIGSSALQSAAFKEHWDVVDLLFDASDVAEVHKGLERSGPGPWMKFEYEVQARRQKNRIAEEIDTSVSSKRSKKM